MSHVLEDSDLRLVERVEAGEPEAEEELCRRFYRVAMTYVSRRVREDVADICQEATMALLKAIRTRTLQERDRPGAFLHTVCRNKIASRIKRGRREVRLDEDWPLAGRDDPARLAEGKIAAERVWMALSQLDQQDQEVLLMRLRDGLSHNEIADRLGVGEGTAKKRYSRARQRLWDRLGGL